MILHRSALLFVLLLRSCGSDPVVDAGPPTPDAGMHIAVPLTNYDSDTFWAAPWPDERLRRPDGTVDLTGFPNPRRTAIVENLTRLVDGSSGFPVSSTIFFPLAAPIDERSLPTLQESLGSDAALFLIDVDQAGGAAGTRAPVHAAFTLDAGPSGARNVLAMLPLQGRPLAIHHLYAAVLTTRIRAIDGTPLEVSAETASLIAGERPAGMSEPAFEEHQRALNAMRASGVDLGRVAATAVFRTWDPAEGLRAAIGQLRAGPPPAVENDFEPGEVFDDYCVYQTTLLMPDFQRGVAPYLTEGGEWQTEAGALVLQRMASSRVTITIPRASMPADGFPTAVFVRTGGGGDRPMVDRGPRAEPGGPAIVPGTGPALTFARAGFAGITVDGPLGGARNTDDWDEQFAVFNINNPSGLRDNIRQSALELMHLSRFIPTVAIDASACPGLVTPAGDSVISLDSTHLTIMGHSMGATIAPLAVALEPAYRAMILSGAGGSWIRNVIYKESPIEVRPAAELLLQYSSIGRQLDEHDPALALLQWAGEPADPQVYSLADDPRHVLMFQGILDTYIPPPVANALSLSLGLDLAGGALDESLSDRFDPLGGLLSYSGGSQVLLPAMGNRADRTQVVVQHAEDGIEDGHEIVFQRPEPRLQYRCFLESMRAGVPRVPARDAAACE